MNRPGSAPAVVFLAERTRLLAVLLFLLWLAGAVFVVLALVLGRFAPPAMGLLAALPLAVAGGLGWFWAGQQPRELCWDGARWSLQQPGAAARATALTRVTVRLDLQRAMLVQARTWAGGGCWIWLQSGSGRSRWHLLRCALHAVDGQRSPEGRIA